MFTFPTQSDNLPGFMALMSTFWTQTYGGANLVRDYLVGCMTNQQQLDNDIRELVATCSRHDCPVFHNELWYSVDLLQSEADHDLISPLSGTQFLWDSQIKEVSHVSNGLIQPTVMMTNGVDFNVDYNAGVITFPFDLFTDPRFDAIPVFDDQGVVTDYKIQLWFLGAKLDWDFIYEQFGYVCNISLPSSQNYKDLVVSILDAVSGATSYLDTAKAVSAIVDIPITKSNGEVVEVIQLDNAGLVVATDKNVYRFVGGAMPVVAAGDVVNAGDPLVESLYFFEPNRGGTPDLTSITLGPTDMLDPSLPGPVTFNNADTAMVVIPNTAGYTKLTWAAGGDPSDVQAFFDLMHAKGVAAGKTLAMCLDSRPQPQPTQPEASNLPATINPMAFVFQNVFRNNAFVVRIKTDEMGPNALGLDKLDLLRQIMPPHVAMLVETI